MFCVSRVFGVLERGGIHLTGSCVSNLGVRSLGLYTAPSSITPSLERVFIDEVLQWPHHPFCERMIGLTEDGARAA